MDLIDRQDATSIPVLPKEHREYQTNNLDDAYELGWYDCQKYIGQLPSAQKTGKWIACDSSEHWKCSECGCRASYWFNEENSSSYELDMSEWLSDYCSNCGARMEREEE